MFAASMIRWTRRGVSFSTAQSNSTFGRVGRIADKAASTILSVTLRIPLAILSAMSMAARSTRSAFRATALTRSARTAFARFATARTAADTRATTPEMRAATAAAAALTLAANAATAERNRANSDSTRSRTGPGRELASDEADARNPVTMPCTRLTAPSTVWAACATKACNRGPIFPTSASTPPRAAATEPATCATLSETAVATPLIARSMA